MKTIAFIAITLLLTSSFAAVKRSAPSLESVLNNRRSVVAKFSSKIQGDLQNHLPKDAQNVHYTEKNNTVTDTNAHTTDGDVKLTHTNQKMNIVLNVNRPEEVVEKEVPPVKTPLVKTPPVENHPVIAPPVSKKTQKPINEVVEKHVVTEKLAVPEKNTPKPAENLQIADDSTNYQFDLEESNESLSVPNQASVQSAFVTSANFLTRLQACGILFLLSIFYLFN